MTKGTNLWKNARNAQTFKAEDPRFVQRDDCNKVPMYINGFLPIGYTIN